MGFEPLVGHLFSMIILLKIVNSYLERTRLDLVKNPGPLVKSVENSGRNVGNGLKKEKKLKNTLHKFQFIIFQ